MTVWIRQVTPATIDKNEPQTGIRKMDMQGPMKLLAFTAVTMFATNLAAQSVTLNSLDGTLSITGELVEYTGETYLISSNVGRLTVAADAVVCVGAACPDLFPTYSEFTISGSRELALNLMPTLLDGFAASLGFDMIEQIDAGGNPQVLYVNEAGEDVVKISFEMLGSSSGVQSLLTGGASLALTTRQAREAESAAFIRAGFDDIQTPELETILALDGLVVVTSNSNTVRTISNENIARVFAGTITDWSALGGPSGPINIYGRPEDSSTGAQFTQAFMRPARLDISDAGNMLDSDKSVADAVAADPNGIGFTNFANIGNARPVSLLGSCGIQSPANIFSIQAEEYPYTTRMYAYKSSGNAQPMVDLLVDYLSTAEAQQLIGFSGYVDQLMTEVPLNNLGVRFLSAALPTNTEITLVQLQSMMVELSAAHRMTITLRFEPGTTQLDGRGEADVARMAKMMADGMLAGKQIMLLGFTDSVGDGEVNQSLSEAQAEQVRQQVLTTGNGQLDPARIETRGYGELSPLGCNEDIEGRRINRRVEVWMR